MEVWIANRDGSGAHPLTGQRAAWSPPVWSPDGTLLLFGASSYGGMSPYGLYVVPAIGGRSKQIPTGSDGTNKRWIGDFPANTRQPGVEVGGFIYYTRNRAGLARIALSDGKEEGLASMSNSYFAVTKRNLFFVRSGDGMLCAFPLHDGPIRESGPIYELNGVSHNVSGFSVDEQASMLLWSEAAMPQLDLMIVRDFP